MTNNTMRSLDTLMQSPEMLTSLERLKDLLPFQSDELVNALIDTARTRVNTTSPEGLEKFYEYLVSYTKYLPHSPELEVIRTHDQLIENFVLFVTKPMREAEREVRQLEAEVYDIVIQHPAMELKNYDFRKRPEYAVEIIEDYFNVCMELPRMIRQKSILVKAVEKIFVDPERLALVMRDRLHGLNNILTIQASNAQGVLKYGDNDIKRASYLKAMQSLLSSEFDLFPNLNEVYEAYPKVVVDVPEESLKVPRPLETRNIIHHLVLNALKAGAGNVTISLVSKTEKMALITVVDDVSGGMPEDIRKQLGKTYIQHDEGYEGGSGLVIVCQHLLPILGEKAKISVESPFRDGNGTRVTLAVPLDPPMDALNPPGIPLDSERRKRITSTALSKVEASMQPAQEAPEVLASVTPINGIAAISESGAPDIPLRVSLDPKSAEFYRKAFFERFRSSGMRMFNVRSTRPLVLTYSLRPWAR